MNIADKLLKYDEKAVFALRELYSKYGYSQYKMGKFEEYDLYVKNKDFLISEGVITFTDTNGRLMALKPDVTLSIIKNTKDIPGFVQKLYYNENVYRVSEKTHTFKEIMQVGLECIGDIDDYCIGEVVSLAAESLAGISESAVLDISHLGILSEVIDRAGIGEEYIDEVIKLIGEKNSHELVRLCNSIGVDEENCNLIRSLVGTYGRPVDVLPKLREMLEGRIGTESLDQLESLTREISKKSFGNILRIDFSVISDTKYYNGIVFKGFIDGIPQSVLSGGQYDRLMKKMQKKSGAIGFAVYLDLLERLLSKRREYDAETVILYGKDTDMELLSKVVEEYKEKGSVSVQRALPEKFTYKNLVDLTKGGEL